MHVQHAVCISPHADLARLFHEKPNLLITLNLHRYYLLPQHINMGSSSSFCFCTLLLLLLLLHPGKSTLAPKSASSKDACLSWRLSVETNNLRNWTVVPSACIGYVTEYMTAGQYEEDYSVAIAQCQAYLKTLHPIGDGKDAWVFDIDETALSGISFLANHKYGGEVVNSTLAEDWIFEAKAPALVGALHLSSQVVSSGFKVFFLTGRDLKYLAATAKNLRKAGYRNWSGLILRGKNDQGKPAVVYKSEKRGELVKRGYRIWGNVGDQWSDLTGNYPGHRTFKLPNPMYYVN